MLITQPTVINRKYKLAFGALSDAFPSKTTRSEVNDKTQTSQEDLTE